MKTARNRLNKIVSFPALAIAFGPGETKLVSDEVAATLEGAAYITIESEKLTVKTQPAPKPAAVEKTDEESAGKKVEKHITNKESDE